MNEEILVQFVSDINDNVVISCYINNRTWKLLVDSNNLQKNAGTSVIAESYSSFYTAEP